MKNGAVFERYLNTLHMNYRRLGLAHIVHVPTPVKVTGNNKGKITGRLTSPVWTDFTGALAGGIAVALEAKYTQGAGPSFALGKISPGQRDVLSSVNELGGVSALIVRRGCIGNKGKLSSHDYLVPASFIDHLTFKSFRWDAVEKFRIPAGKTWIDAVDIGRNGCPTYWMALYETYGWEAV